MKRKIDSVHFNSSFLAAQLVVIVIAAIIALFGTMAIDKAFNFRRMYWDGILYPVLRFVTGIEAFDYDYLDKPVFEEPPPRRYVE